MSNIFQGLRIILNFCQLLLTLQGKIPHFLVYQLPLFAQEYEKLNNFVTVHFKTLSTCNSPKFPTHFRFPSLLQRLKDAAHYKINNCTNKNIATKLIFKIINIETLIQAAQPKQMSSKVKKQPNCPYGNQAKYVCVNPQCRKPGLICQKGQTSQSECWLFHQNCTKIKWSQVQAFSKDNPNTKSPQFMHLQDKIENLFLKALEKIQSQHQKFKIWAKTYGYNLETMKFIKVLMDKNYEQMTGDYMATMLPVLTSKEVKRIETPMIVDSEFQGLRNDIDRILEKIGTLYLKSKKLQKPSMYSPASSQANDNSHPHYASQYSQQNPPHYLHNNNSQNSYYAQKDYSKQTVASVSNNSTVTTTGEFRSKILQNLQPIQSYLEGRVIKSAKLIFRASENNFSIKKFHEMCDNIPDTLTLVHNEFGKKFGGYTPVAWTSDKKHWVADKSLKSFIFSIDMGQKFKLNLAQFAIASNPQRGPTFGCCDICIVDNSNKQKSNCEFPISYNNNGKYVRSQNTSTLFTGNAKGQFYVKEWEVYKLEFE